MNDEVVESAKAMQEVAKASTEAISATQKLGTYIAGLVKEPMDSIVGILSDRLKFVRWQRQLRLIDKVQEIIAGRNLQNELEIIPLKFALPILENATIEENDDLQDLWASLLVATGAPGKNIKIAFVSMLKELDPLDAKILDTCYNYASDKCTKNNSTSFHITAYDSLHQKEVITVGPEDYLCSLPIKTMQDIPIHAEYIYEKLGIEKAQGRSSFDNLVRLRLLAEFIDEDFFDITESKRYEFSILRQGYFYLPSLGEEFVNACMRN